MATEKRLIDARYLTSQMYLICEACQTENIFIDAIIDEIDNAPDVDAVEVVHGWWVEINQKSDGIPWQYRCGICGCPQDYPHKYCPNCGATMDGGKDGKV